MRRWHDHDLLTHPTGRGVVIFVDSVAQEGQNSRKESATADYQAGLLLIGGNIRCTATGMSFWVYT
jgi:hypothetical protein